MNILTRLVLVFSFCIGFASAKEAKVVFDVTSGDSHKIGKHLINSVNVLETYYKKENIDLKVIVVISGDAYKYFIEDLKKSPYATQTEVADVQAKFKTDFQKLNDKYGVIFEMCANGMRARKINPNNLYKFVHADVMKGVYLIEAQNSGYAYIPIH